MFFTSVPAVPPMAPQVVSGCHGGVISVWDVDTGEKTIQFSRCHGDAEITAMAFDGTGRRLLTGGRNGSLRMWNFNNGACLSILKSNYSIEVSWERGSGCGH